jgi:hypothetical protein
MHVNNIVNIITNNLCVHNTVYNDYYNFRHPALCRGITPHDVQIELGYGHSKHVCTNTHFQLTCMTLQMQNQDIPISGNHIKSYQYS